MVGVRGRAGKLPRRRQVILLLAPCLRACVFICDPRVCVYELLLAAYRVRDGDTKEAKGAQRRVAFATQRHFIKRVGFRLMKIDRPW
jgi:hypothetical protein